MTLTPSLRANGSRECAPDDRLREAIQNATSKNWIASSQELLAMTELAIPIQLKAITLGARSQRQRSGNPAVT
jgi:hypothetical protein